MKDYKKRVLKIKMAATVVISVILSTCLKPILDDGGSNIVAYAILPVVYMLMMYFGECAESISRHKLFLNEKDKLENIIENMKSNKMHMESYELEEIIYKLNKDV